MTARRVEPPSGAGPDGAGPGVTVVVVPRERFSTVLTCLRTIYACTETPFSLLVIDGGGPAPLARALDGFAAGHPGCRVVRSERFLRPGEARNLALAHLDPRSEWIAWVDNDVKVHPGWLRHMVRAAQETGARVIHPLYLVEEHGRTLIHVARGTFVEEGDGRRRLVRPVMEHCGRPVGAAAGLSRQADDFLEFHAYLVHRGLQDALGPYPDLGLGDELHFSFRLRELGEPIVFEPGAVVTYVAGPPFEGYDRPYFRFRWHPDTCERAVRALRASLPIAEGYWRDKLAWIRRHRWRIQPWYHPAQRLRRRYQRLARRPGVA